MVSGHAEIECPFCKKVGIKAFHKPSHLEPKVTHISSGTRTKYYRVPESYDIMTGCPHCGKSRKEIELVFETGIMKSSTHNERLERLKKAGLPTIVKSFKKGEK